MEVVIRELSKMNAKMDAIGLAVAALNKKIGASSARNAPPCRLPISDDDGFRLLNEKMRNSDFLGTLVSKLS